MSMGDHCPTTGMEEIVTWRIILEAKVTETVNSAEDSGN